jgi:small-conductance mechanosensitive channel
MISGSSLQAETNTSVNSNSSRINNTHQLSLPNQLSRESVANLLSDLSDKEVREMLKVQLNSLADKNTAQQTSDQTITLKEGMKNLKRMFRDNYQKSLNLSSSLEKMTKGFRQDRAGYTYLIDFYLSLLFCLVIPFIIDYFLAKYLRKKFDINLNGRLPTLKNKVITLSKVLLLRSFNLILFYILAEILMEETFTNTIEEIAAETVLDYIFVARLAFLLAAVVLSPKDKTLRLYSLECPKAEILTNRLVIISLIAASDILLDLSFYLGLNPGESGIGFWLNLLFYVALIWLVWRSRYIFQEMLLLGRERITQSQQQFVKIWPKVVVVLSIFVWLALEYVLANYGIKEKYINAAALTLVIINFAPFINIAIFDAVEYFLPVNQSKSERQVSFQYEIQDNVIRIIQLFSAGIVLFGLSILWGIDYANLSGGGNAKFLLAIVIQLITVPVLAYVVWLSIDTYVAHRLASEKPEDEQQEESEGGTGLSRMATVLPLLRISAGFIIIVFSIFGVFASLGINTTPLLAGASVIGLAIGFGAQTLVKDIVSGVFFLVDDAFRMGEYVDVGGIKGTVERIALRSLRLRHHLGAQHTIPYGEIAKLTNFSRDWVIMKLRFRVPHDTDVNKIKKLFKKLGKELLNHPELGKDFIAPFKSQGVLEVDEVGMLIRGKFTCKPGGQFMIRKEIYVQVQKVFAENGIEFAKRRVEVQIPDYLSEDAKRSVSAAAGEVLQEQVPVKT